MIIAPCPQDDCGSFGPHVVSEEREGALVCVCSACQVRFELTNVELP